MLDSKERTSGASGITAKQAVVVQVNCLNQRAEFTGLRLRLHEVPARSCVCLRVCLCFVFSSKKQNSGVRRYLCAPSSLQSVFSLNKPDILNLMWKYSKIH